MLARPAQDKQQSVQGTGQRRLCRPACRALRGLAPKSCLAVPLGVIDASKHGLFSVLFNYDHEHKHGQKFEHVLTEMLQEERLCLQGYLGCKAIDAGSRYN